MYTTNYQEPITLDGYSFVDTSSLQHFASAGPFVGSRSGTRVPGFRELIAKGLNATSPYTLNRYKLMEQRPGSASLNLRHPGPPVSNSTHVFYGYASSIIQGDVAHLLSSSSEADAIALQKMYAKLDSEVSHFKGASFLAEALDVVRQFGSPLRSIVDLTNRRLNRLALERAKLSGSTSFKRIKWGEIVAASYLEYSFGLAPLISETAKLAEALARFNLYDPPALSTKYVTRGETTKAHSAQWTPANVGNVSIRFVRSTRDLTSARVQYVVGLQGSIEADFQSNARLQQLLGFKPADWVPAIWEAVPWSWLIDYFTNVGGILQAAATEVTRVNWVSKSVTFQTDHSRYHILQPPQVGFPYTVDAQVGTHGGFFTVRRTTMTRSTPPSLGVPPLVFKHPFADYKKLANMVAVLVARQPSSSALWLF